jgi:hypothetical protein
LISVAITSPVVFSDKQHLRGMISVFIFDAE